MPFGGSGVSEEKLRSEASHIISKYDERSSFDKLRVTVRYFENRMLSLYLIQPQREVKGQKTK